MFVLKADSPEATRDAIVKWLNLMASNHRIAAARMSGIHKREVETARANSYQEAADFLGNAKVETSVARINEQQAYDEYTIKCYASRIAPMNFNEWRAMGRPKSYLSFDGNWPTPWPTETNP